MANVKMTYINAVGGYVQPTATTDVVQSVGKIDLTGVAGVALTTNGADITGLPATPSGSTAAASKAYVDSVAGGTYTAGNGIDIVGTTISAEVNAAEAMSLGASGIALKYDINYGLTVDSTTGLRIDLATDPGLEFNGGNLRIKVASADELSLDANGLNVEGVPTQFKIGTSATSANVTATNVNSLTDSSTITNLHRHDKNVFTATASLSLGQGFPAYFDGTGGVYNAEADILQAKAGVVGISLDNYTGGGPAFIQSSGLCTVFTGLTAGLPYYLPNSQGVPVPYSSISSGNRIIRIGYALNATTILVNVQDMGVKP